LVPPGDADWETTRLCGEPVFPHGVHVARLLTSFASKDRVQQTRAGHLQVEDIIGLVKRFTYRR